MSKTFLDFRKFTHVKSDKKTVTLEHVDGHQITLFTNALGKDTQDVLKKMSEEYKPEGTFQEQNEVAQENKEENPQLYAKGGAVSPIEDITNTYNTTMDKIGYGPDMLPPSSIDGTAGPTPADSRSNLDYVNQTFDKSMSNMGYSAPSPESAQTFSGVPTAPAMPGLSAQEATLPSAAEQGGLASAAAPPSPPGALDPASLMVSGYKQSKQGINQEAAAIGALGDKQAAILNEQAAAQAEAVNQYKKDYSVLEAERQAHIADIQAGHIDPNKYWDNNSKVAAAIGMIIGGFNPTNSPNAAMNFLKFQMEQNLQAQQANLNSNQNLLNANLRQFGNLKDAQEFTRVMQADVVSNQLKMAAAKAQSPMAKAAALRAAGQLDTESAQKFEAFAKKKALDQLTASAQSGDPSKMNTLIAGLEAAGQHEMAKDYRSRAVPGLGFANDLSGAKDLREMQATTKTVSQGIKRLREIASIPGKSISPELSKEAESIRTQMIGRLRVPLTGPGAMSEGERMLLEKAIPDVTAIFSMDNRNQKALETLNKGVLNGYRNMAIANGLKAPQETTNDPKAQAMQWLQANPNHPKAATVRKALGVK